MSKNARGPQSHLATKEIAHLACSQVLYHSQSLSSRGDKILETAGDLLTASATGECSPMFFEKNEKKNKTASVYRLIATKKGQGQVCKRKFLHFYNFTMKFKEVRVKRLYMYLTFIIWAWERPHSLRDSRLTHSSKPFI